jgi:hypothetical protein
MNYEHWSVTAAMIDGCEWENPPSQAATTLLVGHFTVAYSYVVDGNCYSGEFHSPRAWEKGTELTILYNPEVSGESLVCDGDESESSAAVEWVFGLLEMIDLS